MNEILSPSLLSADFTNLAKECADLEKAKVKWLHLDIMDGMFVPNITFGVPLIKALRKITSLFFDTHLMIEKPERYFEDFAKAGCNLLVPHIETLAHPQRALALIHDLGVKAGIALNPSTPLSEIRWLLPNIDLILIMSVNPGFSGQSFIPQSLEKISECRSFINNMGYPNIVIEADGGVNLSNTSALIEAGANVLVSGSAFFNFRNASLALSKFEEIFVSLNQSQSSSILKKLLEDVNNWQ